MLFRIKAALITVLMVAGATAGAAWYVGKTLYERTVVRVEGEVTRAHLVLERQTRLEGLDLALLAAECAREDRFVQIFAKPTVEEQRVAAYVAIDERKARIESTSSATKGTGEGLMVGIFGVVDAHGAMMSRDLKPDWRRGEVLTAEFPLLAEALKGAHAKDVWNLQGAMYRVGAAPIKDAQGTLLGALFVGFAQSETDARAARELVGADVAYFLNGKVHASSFAHRDSATESAEEKALAAQLFEGPKYAEQAVSSRQATQVFHVRIGREEWIAAAAPLRGNATASKSGFVVLQSLREAEAHIVPITGAIYGLGLLAILMVLAAWQMTVRRFVVPLDRVEAGVSEVINGNQEYVFESPSQDFEGLANLLNVMLARLLGRPEPGEDEDDEDKVTRSVVDMQ